MGSIRPTGVHVWTLEAGDIAMSDSETPQDNPEHAPAGSSPTPGPMSGALTPQPGPPTPQPPPLSPHAHAPAPPLPGDQVAPPAPVSAPTAAPGTQAPPIVPAQSPYAAAAAAAPGQSAGAPASGRPKGSPNARKGLAGVVALLCVVAGCIASLLGAQALARNDASEARSSSQQGSAAVASALKLAIQREEELAVSAGTFFAGNPNASPAEFARWVRWARTLRRFPELDNLGLVVVIRKPQLAALQARIAGRPLTAPPAGSAPSAGESIRVVPASNHSYYCLAVAELVRSPAAAPPAGWDYCAKSSALLLARDAGKSRYLPILVGGVRALAVETPVYRGNVTPHSVFGRTAAAVGWLREALLPSVVLNQVLRAHPHVAARLSYRTSSGGVAFNSANAPPNAQSSTTSLHNGWTVTTFAASVATGVLANADARTLLISGVLISVLLGLLVFVLLSPRAPAPAPRAKTREVPNEDLYDVLTGLPNRALMLDRAECMLARAGRQSGLLVGALFIDIDWFKDVNEKLGESAGDQLLANVAERLEAVVRAGDTVGRPGGDEFVILVESAARGARLDSLARRVIEALHKPFDLQDFGPNFFMTASIGLAFGRYASPEDLLRDAQLALHAAKAAGKDRYTLFNANMRSVIEGRGVLEVELNTALQDGQFVLLYQPIYDLNTGKVAALEARIRWQHPKQGELPPADFMALAEETGLIVPIGRWMLEEACSRAAAWNVAGQRAGVSVQVSAAQLNREGFATDVRRALQQSGIEPSLLTLEVAETTVMSDVTAAVERLAEIKRLGVRVAIDDFGGSGYAYHSDLRRLPLDFLEVDRSSLAASDDEDYRTWLLEAILIVGRDLSLTVVAKGIETYEQLTTLQGMGCTMAQGLFMGKPTPADALDSLFEVDIPTPRAIAPDAPRAAAADPLS
jgi:diguanylate cyclase (GGDEF)-like protein